MERINVLVHQINRAWTALKRIFVNNINTSLHALKYIKTIYNLQKNIIIPTLNSSKWRLLFLPLYKIPEYLNG